VVPRRRASFGPALTGGRSQRPISCGAYGRSIERTRPYAAVLVPTLVALGLSACGGGDGSSSKPLGSPASTGPPIEFAPAPCGTYSGRGCAPQRKRVDLAKPSFSHPTQITNPLFPISGLHSAVLLGSADGKPFRSETTLLPGTETIAWSGGRVETLVSQYVAYVDGRLEEVARDRYAQADDGSVWYFGEDVMDYKKGTVAMTEGTWLAGREGPPAMIMPARPRVGDVFRPENVTGIVFEEVEVKAVDRTVQGARGPVRGAILAEELHADRTFDHKIFAPGHGEFRTTGGGDLEALALAAPADAVRGPQPAELQSLSTGAVGILELARIRDWKSAALSLDRMRAAWRTVRTSTKPPAMVAARLSGAMRALAPAVRARRPGRVGQAAIDLAQSVLDLKLRYRPPAEIDATRFGLWTQQLRVDADAKDLAGVTGDVAVLEWIRDRFAPTLPPAGREQIDVGLRGLRAATDAGNLPAAADHAARLAAGLRDLGAL
jgi:hypothetical protein